MKYELVIVWADDDKDIFEFNDRDAAEQCARRMKMAAGNQIAWCGVRRKVK